MTLFGFWGLNGFWTDAGLLDLNERLEMTVFQTATTDTAWAVGHLLPTARGAGIRVTLRLTGGHVRYTDGDGDFDMAAWMAVLDTWKGSGVQEFIDDGTLVGHMLLDDIHNFPGRDPSGAELDQLARYSKRHLPRLMTYVREEARNMPEPPSGRYRFVDASVNQYRIADGDIHDFAEKEAARAAELDLGVINGLNIANGGDGSSGQPGWAEGRWAMGGEEILRYGQVLARVPSMGMFLNWEYDGEERWADGSVGSAWFDQPAQREALVEVARIVAEHPAVPLMKDRPWWRSRIPELEEECR